jgi:hypothetical protein
MISLSALARTAAAAANPADQPWAPHDTQVLIVAVIGIAIVVTLIVWLKFHAFLALTIGALFVGIASGLPLDKVTGSSTRCCGGGRRRCPGRWRSSRRSSASRCSSRSAWCC